MNTKMNIMKKILAALLALMLMGTGLAVFAEQTTDAQKLDAAYTLALNAIAAEDYETAKEYVDVCFAYCDPAANPEMYADLLLKRACINVIEEKNDLAVLSLDAALRIKPDLADAYLVRAQVFASEGSIDQAIASLEKYIELSEDSAMYETVAQLYEASGDAEAAQAAYDKFVEGPGADTVEAGFQAGLYRMQSGRYEEAVAAFEAYAEDETYGAGALYNIAICKMNLGDYPAAAAAFTSCEEKGGDYMGLYYNRGVCNLLNGEWTGAAADFEKSIETESYVDDARYNLAICQMQLEDYETAIATFTEVIGDGEEGAEEAETPAYDGAYYYRATCRAAVGEFEGALADYTVCIEHGYDLAQSYYQRAQVYGALGDSEHQNSDLQDSLKAAD